MLSRTWSFSQITKHKEKTIAKPKPPFLIEKKKKQTHQGDNKA
jgi:hypothetical protein